MTCTVEAADLVALAKTTAELLPAPPTFGGEDDPLLRSWEKLMRVAAQFLARRAAFDESVLQASLWPPVVATANPPWRILLTLALVQARSRTASTFVEELPAVYAVQ